MMETLSGKKKGGGEKKQQNVHKTSYSLANKRETWFN